MAKSWTRKCKYSHNPCTVDYDFIGENIYLGPINSTPKEVISLWFSEREYYNFEDMTCSKMCGNYTQVGT